MENSGLHLAVSEVVTNISGLLIQQRRIDDNTNYWDRWELEELDNLQVVLCGVDADENHDHLSSLQDTRDTLHRNDFNNVHLYSGEFTATECMNYLDTCNVFAIRCHGLTVNNLDDEISLVGILLKDNPANTIFPYDYGSMPDGYMAMSYSNDFSNMNLALFVGCYTAFGGETGNNLVTKIVDLGATVAIGFSDSIDCKEANLWTRKFYEYMCEGNTVEDAINKVKEDMDDSEIINYVVACGNLSYRLGD